MVLLALISYKFGTQFEALQRHPMTMFLGPAVIFFYLTYVTDIALYFYYLKNSHLKRKYRNIFISAYRISLTIALWTQI